uniref:RNA polymerase II C-terminal domain phosphatase-like n=2 Tax=Oryza brachyantha TaxID=4533 RepID=J3LHZ9_ORYBR
MEPGRDEEDEDASAGGAPKGRFLAQRGVKEDDDDAEEDYSGGGSGEDDDDEDEDDDASGVSLGTIGSDAIMLPPGMKNAHVANLLRARKLILVLDLDNTLINSVGFRRFSPTEKANGFTKEIRDDPSRGLFRLEPYRVSTLTKLRPFVHEFLREASGMFEMHVYTLGGRSYARAVVKLLDPDGVYFGERIISFDDSSQPYRKSLDAVVGPSSASATEHAAVVILDDKARVWDGYNDNLIEMEPYLYFASDCRRYGSKAAQSLAERRLDESESDGALAVTLRVLRQVHYCFFSGSVCCGSFSDVRELIRQMRREVLRGCTVVFTGVIPPEVVQPSCHDMWRKAEQLGATCSDDVGPEVTHVVAANPSTSEARWAQEHGKSLVNPRWISAARFRWSKPKEEDFPVKEES